MRFLLVSTKKRYTPLYSKYIVSYKREKSKYFLKETGYIFGFYAFFRESIVKYDERKKPRTIAVFCVVLEIKVSLPRPCRKRR